MVIFSILIPFPFHLKLPKKTDAFPLCLSKFDIKETDISTFSKDLLNRHGLKLPKPNEKLVAHHNRLKDCLMSLPLHQFLIGKGCQIDKVHWVYKFKVFLLEGVH